MIQVAGMEVIKNKSEYHQAMMDVVNLNAKRDLKAEDKMRIDQLCAAIEGFEQKVKAENLKKQRQSLTENNIRSISSYSIDQCIHAVKLLQARISQLVDPAYPTHAAKDLAELNLSARAYGALTKSGFKTVADVLDHGLDKICYLRLVGEKARGEIVDIINKELQANATDGEVVELKIELGDENDIWGWVNIGNCLITTVSDTVTGVIDNIRMQIKDHQEHELKDDEKWSKVDPDAIRFQIKFQIIN